MIDANKLLNPVERETIKQAIAKKGYDVSVLDHLAETLVQLREKRQALDELRKQRNSVAKDQSVSIEEKRALRVQISELEETVAHLDARSKDFLYDIPNLPDEDAPIGATADDNVVIEECSEYYHCPVDAPKPHWEIAKELGILDMEGAAKISGSMFGMFRGAGAKLLRALVYYCFTLHEGKYLEVLPPHMVSTKSLTFTGHLPKFANEQYKCINDDLWLIPTAEVPLTASFAETVIPAEELPRRCMGYTVAFRREAGSAGKETRGLQRLHEFHKVELLKIVRPEDVVPELKDLLDDCLRIIKDLKLQYRILDLCTGDMGDKYARCYDIEVFSPGVQRWLEVSSVGHFSDYQARRASIRYTDENGKRQIAYTMNGSGMATPRVWTAIIETYQQPDGSVQVPEVLRPFMGCDYIR